MELSPQDWKYVAERADSFVGREWVFSRVSQFLAGPPGTFLLRGDPGTGKTAVAARLAQASRGRTPAGNSAPPLAPGTISAAVFCRVGQATVDELIWQLARQLDHSVAGFAAARQATARSQAGVGEITNVNVSVAGDVGPGAIVTGVHLPAWDAKTAFDAALAVPLRRLREQTAALPVVLLVDAVDEAVTADHANPLSWKLSELGGVHLIVTCRPDSRVLDDFRRASDTVDLVADAPSGRDDVRAYVTARLRGHGPDGSVAVVSDRIAQEADGNFLYAFHVTGALDRSRALAGLDEDAAHRLPLPPGGLPGVYADFLDRQIAHDERRWKEELRPVLAGLSVALGNGFTRPQLAAIASQLAGREFSETKVADITREFGQFLSQSARNGPFRVYHQSFARFLTDPGRSGLVINPGEANRAVVRALVSTGPERLSQYGSGAALDPYVVAHLAAHAALGGPAAWQELADHPRILDRLDPGSVATAGLPALAAYRLPPEILGVIGTANRLSAVPLGQRHGLRQLATARHLGVVSHRGDPDPAALWSVRWAHVTPQPIHRTLSCQAGSGSGATVEAFTAPDGRSYLAIGDPYGALHVWDPVTDTPVGPPLDEWSPTAIAAFPVVAFKDRAGRPLLAAGGQPYNAVRVWDPVAGTALAPPLTLPWGRASAVAVFPSPDERLILAVADSDRRGLIHRWDALAGTAAGPPLNCFTEVLAMATFLRSDGRPVLVTGGADGTVRAWDPTAGVPVGPPLAGHTDRVEAVATFSDPDGRRLVATGSYDATIRVWDLLTGQPVGPPLTGHTGMVWDIVHFPAADGRPLLASGGGDDTVRIWDPLVGTQVSPPLTGHHGWVKSLTTFPAPDGRPLLATGGSDGTVRVWDPASANGGQTAASATVEEQAYGASWWVAHHIRSVTAFRTEDGRPIAAAGTEHGVIRMWDAVTGTPVSQPWTNSWRANSLAGFTTRKRRTLLAAACDDGDVWLIDMAGRQFGKPLSGPAEAWTVVALPGPGRRALLAIGYRDGATWLWDPIARTRVGRPLNCPGWVRAMAVLPAPDGRALLATASDEPGPRSEFDLMTTLRVWDPFAGRLLYPPLTTSSWVWALAAFTAPDGRILIAAGGNDYRNARSMATAGRLDHPVRVWDPAAGTELGPPLAGHKAPVWAMTVLPAPDGRPLLASGGLDHRVLIQDPVDRTELVVLQIDSSVNDLTPVDESLLVGADDGVMMITPNFGRWPGRTR